MTTAIVAATRRPGIVAIFVISRSLDAIVVVRQTQAYLVERLGRYSRTLDAGLHFLVPFLDKVRAQVDLKEQVYPFPPQSVITSDNLVVDIDSVIYLQVTRPKAAVYEIAELLDRCRAAHRHDAS